MGAVASSSSGLALYSSGEVVPLQGPYAMKCASEDADIIAL